MTFECEICGDVSNEGWWCQVRPIGSAKLINMKHCKKCMHANMAETHNDPNLELLYEVISRPKEKQKGLKIDRE